MAPKIIAIEYDNIIIIIIIIYIVRDETVDETTVLKQMFEIE